MKIIVLHGEDTLKSYERLKKFIQAAKDRSWEVSYLDESSQRFQDDLSASSLFGAERFFILQDVRKIGKDEISWLNKRNAELSGNLIIYSEGNLNQTFLKSLPKEVKIEEFKLPKLIWNFLDHIYPGNSKKVLQEFHKVIEKDPPEFVFSLIAKLFRDLYWIKVDSRSIPYPSWRVAKLKVQSSKFKVENLIAMIGELSDIDVRVKTGKADLVSSLDLFMIKQLE